MSQRLAVLSFKPDYKPCNDQNKGLDEYQGL